MLTIEATYEPRSKGYLGYRKLRLSDGRILAEQRYVMELHLGRRLSEDEVVHHIDGDKTNNNLDNLELMARAKHSAQHSSIGRAMIEIVCAYCGKKAFKERRQVVPKMDKGQRDFYCNRSCMAKHFGGGRPKGKVSQLGREAD